MRVALSFLVLAIIAHLYLFNSIPLQFDELLMYELISRYHTWELIPYLYVEEIQQPLGYLLGKLFLTLDSSTFIMRLPTLILTLMTPWALYKLARLSLSPEDSLKAGVFLLLFYPFMMYSGSMRPYVSFVFFTILAFYQYSKPYRDSIKLYVSLLALFLIHPLGSVISFIFLGNILLKRKGGINLLLASALVGLLILTIASLYRHEKIGELLINLSYEQYFRALYNFSFLISGREFFTFVMALVFFVGSLKIAKRKVNLELEKIWLVSFSLSIISALVLMGFFGKHLYPRHYMFLLPGLSIIVLRLINATTERRSIRHLLFIAGCLTLTYKSILKEKLHNVPFEIDSLNMARSAKKMANGSITIVSCGNCFSYYLTRKNHLCSGGSIPENYFENANEVIYLELNYVKNKCSLENIKDPFRIQETNVFKGGKIHHLVFQDSN
jgi:hypothetical protein